MNDKPIPHGTLSGYNAHKCRCEDCRAANSAYNRQYYAKNREQILDQKAARYAKEPSLLRSRARESMRRNRSKHREAVAEYQRQHYRENWATVRDRHREYNASASRKNRDRIKQKNEQSRSLATRHRELWTFHEDEVARNLNLTCMEVALSLKRTLRSVQGRRTYLRKKAMA